MVKKWRQTLIESANLSGWHYDHGDETKFIEIIVKEISAIVGRVPLSVAKYPVSVGCRVEKVKSLLSMGSDDVWMIGIWRTGGIGKTTIANALYNNIACQFGGCSFLENERTVQMHDLIQLMGQDIVKQECPDDPGKRSRLWCYDDVFEVLSEDTGTNAVKGIVLDLPTQEELDISPSAFTHTRRLRLLIILNAQISGGPICLPNDLRWLEWPEHPFTTLKFSAGPKKLVWFDVHNSHIKEL